MVFMRKDNKSMSSFPKYTQNTMCSCEVESTLNEMPFPTQDTDAVWPTLMKANVSSFSV